MGLNPEFREEREWDFEKRRLAPEMEKRLRKALESKKGVFADIVLCPNRSCGTPLKVEILEDVVQVSCSACGFTRLIQGTD